jgi:hypothetical protein
MHHWSKAKAAKLEKNIIIIILKGIKLIKFIYTCRSQVEKIKSLDKSYIIISKKYYDNFDVERFYIHY